MKGTWQGSGTWQTSGFDLEGLLVPVVLVAVAVAVVEFILSIIIWLAIAAGVLLALLAAVLVWWLRGAPKRRAEFTAAYAAAFEAHRPAQVTATVIPKVSQGTSWPAVAPPPQVTFNFYGLAPEQQAAVIRTALPGQRSGDIITEE